MPVLQVVSSAPGAGKSTIVAALALGFARAGQRVRIERLGAGPAADADAATFGEFLFASSSGHPVAAPPPVAPGEVLLLEMDAGASPTSGLPALIAVNAAPSPEDTALASALGDRFIGTIAVSVDPRDIEGVARDLTNDGLRPLALLGEDPRLAAPSVAEISAALNAKVLYSGDNESEVVEDVIIAPVYADPARPHFRRFAHKAILAPFNKTDLHLVAIETQAACLVITGGKDPSPYVLDRAQHDTTTVLLSTRDTPGTVASLAGVWDASRFRGESKAQAAYELLEARLDIPGLLKKLES